MPRSALLLPSGVPRYVLQAGRDFFVWLYADHASPQRCQLEYWAWAVGLETAWFKDPKNQSGQRIIEHSSHWKWLRLRGWLRNEVEKILGAIHTRKPQIFPVTPRILSVGPDYQGRLVIRWRPILPKNPTAKAFLRYFLDELLCDLDRAGAEALATCPVCGHYFMRVLANRGKYCSPHCRNKARVGTTTASGSNGGRREAAKWRRSKARSKRQDLNAHPGHKPTLTRRK